MADLNNVTLTGNITKDLEFKTTSSGKGFCKTSIAVNGFSKDDVNFINIIAWEKTAEVLSKYCKKGDKIAVVGRIQNGMYEKDGVKHYTTDIVITSLTLLGNNKKENSDVGAAKGTKFETADEPSSSDSFPF